MTNKCLEIDIYNYLRDVEKKFVQASDYMSKQKSVEPPMRAVFVDWLVKVCKENRMQNETLHLAVTHLDRCLMLMQVDKSKLQLVGSACLLLAAKFVENVPIKCKDIVYINDETCTKIELLETELLVWKVLGFNVSAPTRDLFINHMCKMLDSDEETKELAMYIAELSLVSGDRFVSIRSSLVAASCIALARATLGHKPWPDDKVKMCGLSEADVLDFMAPLHSLHAHVRESSLHAVRDKYKYRKSFRVANIPSLDTLG